ncbi:hypothetical protein GCM10011317_31910 [Niveispirillum cyanobacteriorum]|nr:hypothetical protein GCM10011317_31910 [Niveispirillum cyanobacteriorum]
MTGVPNRAISNKARSKQAVRNPTCKEQEIIGHVIIVEEDARSGGRHGSGRLGHGAGGPAGAGGKGAAPGQWRGAGNP